MRSAGVRRVGLLGTGFTMAQPFYADRLASHGLDVISTTRLHVQAAVERAPRRRLILPCVIDPGLCVDSFRWREHFEDRGSDARVTLSEAVIGHGDQAHGHLTHVSVQLPDRVPAI